MEIRWESLAIALLQNRFSGEHLTKANRTVIHAVGELKKIGIHEEELKKRIAFAIIKLGKSDLSKMKEAASLALSDWRDVLVAAKFANDIAAHNTWAERELRIRLYNA